jgi:hypothetical protein
MRCIQQPKPLPSSPQAGRRSESPGALHQCHATWASCYHSGAASQLQAVGVVQLQLCCLAAAWSPVIGIWLIASGWQHPMLMA